MSSKHSLRATFALFTVFSTAAFARGAADPHPELPEVLPSCNSPQPYNVPQSLGDTGNYAYTPPAVAWNGTDYGLLSGIYGNPNLRFQKAYADGSSTAVLASPSAVPLGAAGFVYQERTPLIWTGTQYAAAWTYYDYAVAHTLIAFARMNPDGVIVGSVQRASFVTTTPAVDSHNASVSYNAATGYFLVVWNDNRSGNQDVYGTVFNGQGQLSSANAHDLLLSRDGAGNPLAGDQQYARTASSPAGGASTLTIWQDNRVALAQIYGRTLNLNTDGTPAYFGTEYALTSSPSGGAFYPALAATAGSYGLAWQDSRIGTGPEIYAARLDGSSGQRTGAENRITNTSGLQGYAPAISWTGSEFGVSYGYFSGSLMDLWFSRVSGTGTALSSPTQITTGWFPSNYLYSELAFGRAGFVAGIQGYNLAGHYAVAVGCAYDYYPPSCPSGAAVAQANATAATLSWLPVADSESEIAYYEIFRGGQSVGRTSATKFTLTGLTPGTGYDLSVSAVDADERQQPACPVLEAATPNNLCTSQGALTSPAPLGGQGVTNPSAVVWNGTNFTTAYTENGKLVLQKIHPDGNPAGLPVTVATNVYNAHGPGLVWNGSGYGIAWYATDGKFYLQRLNPDGSAISAPVSFDAITVTPYYSDYWQIALSWSGSKYAATWFDNRNSATTGLDVYATIFNSDGTVAGAGAYFAIPVSTASGAQYRPVIVWSPGVARFLVAFEDDSPTVPSIMISQLDPATGIASAPVALITPAGGGAFRPALTSDGYYPLLAWQDTHDVSGGSEIYASTLTPAGTRYYGYDNRITNDPAGSYNAGLSYAGNGIFYVYWNDTRGGSSQLWMQRLNYQFPQGLPTRLAASPILHLGRGAASAAGHLVTAARSDNAGQNYYISAGCLSDATPPTCPSGITASGITQTEATLSWQTSNDPESGVLAYNVFRDNAFITQTQSASFTDSGLNAGGTYAYKVQPVNGAEVANTGCNQTVTVTTPGGAGACSNGQTAATLHTVGGATVPAQTAIVFNGSEFGTVYADAADNHLYFRRLFPDGTPVAAKVDLGPVFAYYAPGLVWNGTGYAVSWLSVAGSGSMQFALLSPTGAFTYGPVSVSAVIPYVTGYGTVSLASSGTGYAVAWNDSRAYATQGYDIYATLLNADGTIAGAGAYHDIAIGATVSNELFPAIAWSLGAQRYLLAWEENSVTPVAIWRSLLNPADGTASAPVSMFASSGGGAYQPKLAADPYGFLMVWGDGRNNATDSYFARLNANGFVVTAQTKAEAAAPAFEPFVAWNGEEYGIFWNDGAGDGNNIWFQRVSAGGVAIGGNLQATQTADLRRGTAAFGVSGYLVTGAQYLAGYSGLNYAGNFGCAADSTPATCPGNLLAYNVSGTQATISWSPAGDPESGIAQYVLYRNNAELARTATTVFTDTGLGLSSPYNYMVQPVNGRGVQNFACTASVYVKTSATLTLTLGKSTPDALLNWTDAGLNNYTIFRGTSPQVMSLIGATPALSAPDPNVLNDGMSYFYTVDDPGQ